MFLFFQKMSCMRSCWCFWDLSGFFKFLSILFLEMASINVDFFQTLSADTVMIKIWEFSEHVHHKSPPDDSTCNCHFYLNCWIEAVRRVWDENYMFFDTALYYFQFHRKNYIEIMSIKNEQSKEYFVECILRE